MRSLFSTVVLAGTALATEKNTLSDVCRTLVLSGGGNNGSWEVGALWGLVNYGNVADFAYEVVTGVSAGAMNTAVIAGYEIGDEKALVEFGSQTWLGLQNSDIWKDWSLGKASFLIMGGLLDDAPLKTFLQSIVSKFTGFKRRVVLSAVNVDTGEYTDFTRDNIGLWELPDAAVSSASIPFVFPNHSWRMGTFMDGGTVYNVNAASAINQCLEAGYEESQIVMDVLICGDPSAPDTETEVGDTFANYMRIRDLRSYYLDTDSIATTMYSHPDVTLRYLIKQTGSHFSGMDELNFDGAFTWPAQEQGRKDAQDALNGTNGANVKSFIEQWNLDEVVRSQFPKVGDYLHARQIEEKEKFDQ